MSWRPYERVHGLHLLHVPAKVCVHCRARSHVPSREAWWWKPGPGGLLSTCAPCHRHLDAVRRREEGARLLHGLAVRPRRCPKCEALLEQEPGYARCRWGCGKLWPIRGASLLRQLEFELRSGLLQIA
jgi:hypothetical protein